MKIIETINVMIDNPQLFSDVSWLGESYPDAYIFLYKSKYIWAINKMSNGDYALDFFRQKAQNNLQDYFENLYQEIVDQEVVYSLRYNSSDFLGKESFQSFQQLYQLVLEQAYQVNEVFDDILSDKKTDDNIYL